MAAEGAAPNRVGAFVGGKTGAAKGPPFVSIIIPCYNCARYVGEAIQSALAQTHEHKELIVVDDGSTDDSLASIRSFGDSIRSISTSRGGAPAARNRGLALARGEFIQFLDADDVLLPEKIEVCLRVFAENIDMVFTDMAPSIEEDSGGAPEPLPVTIARWLERRLRRPYSVPWDPSNQLEYTLRNAIGTPSSLHRASCLRGIGGFREGLANMQDIELHFRMTLAGLRFSKINAVLVLWRHHDSPDRIRNSRETDLWALEGTRIMLDQAMQAEVMTERIRSAFADRFAFHGRRAYRDGHKRVGLSALHMARRLHRFPRPTRVPLFNMVSRIIGTARLEDCIATIIPKRYRSAIAQRRRS